MVVCSAEHILQADIIFVIENTAVNGAYINDLKSNYIIPTLEYFSQGNIDESNYVSDNANALYGIVTYQAADCLPHPSSDTYGPFSSPGKVLGNIERLELIGGKGESHANIAEGLATALCCFDDLEEKRDVSSNPQKHCILICNSPPYLLPSMESPAYAGKNVEQLAALLQERNINLSIISPRKIPQLYKLFEKAGGDLGASQTKNYAKDPRHLVLLKGFSLKERPISPPPCVSSSQSQIPTTTLPMTSLPSPLASNDSPLSANTQATQNMLGNSTSGPVGVSPIGQAPVYRPPNPQGMTQPMVSPGMVNTARGNMMSNMQMPMQTLPAPPGYHTSPAGMGNRPPPRWSMPPPQPQPQRPYMPGQQVNTTQGSALIAQLTQPPTSLTGSVNQFGQIGSNSPLSAQQQQQQQQQQMRMTQQQNIQTSMAPTVPMQQTSNTSQVTAPVQAVTSQAQQQAVQQPSQQLNAARERHTIWQGLLEWIEKPKNPTDQQKITKHVPCQVSANSKNGEPELKADGWPSKLIMQLMPKQLIGSIGGAYLKNSKSVLFHPQNCEALESLTKVMSSGFAGCVHFTSNPNPPACDIKVLILLYTSEKRAYLGFIPNDQGAFVDRLRKVIQEQKSTQMMRQGQAGGGSNMNQQGPVSMGGTPPQMPGANVVTSQSAPQQGLMMSQTNTMTMGGGQLTQNVVTSTGQPGGGIGGVLGQNLPGGGMQPRMRMQGIQQGLGPQGNQQVGPASNIAPGMMGAPGQRPQFENQLQVERQQNLEKINQLKQTLEAAQQQEQQYKSQLERISHMKTSQLQEALQIAQQQEMQYQRLANQTNQAAANAAAQQQRMMRPVISNNPGLRHLLQAQPQYRQQMLGMQQMGGSTPRPQMGQQMQNTGNATQGNFDDVPNFDYM